jgi:hypothetical protein
MSTAYGKRVFQNDRSGSLPAEGEAEGPFGKADVHPRISAVRGLPGVTGTSSE